ncbi:hypothetical protein AX14_000666 [Amanita brunnescens Koide BX004]|nr:hypothetical protein AX14_000666 [Amanita brunnescens Koide BX004]
MGSASSTYSNLGMLRGGVLRIAKFRNRGTEIRLQQFIMPIAKGTFSGHGSNFQGRFYPEGYIVSCVGNFAQDIPHFNVPNATITYNDLTDFVGTFTIAQSEPPSYVGEYTVDITFSSPNGKVFHLTGELETPIDHRYFVFSGSGLWRLE